MSVLLDCWKGNNFSDAACAKEIVSFNTCVTDARVSERIIFFKFVNMDICTGKYQNKASKRLTDNNYEVTFFTLVDLGRKPR